MFVKLPEHLRDTSLIERIDLALYRFLFTEYNPISDQILKEGKDRFITTRIDLSKWGQEHFNMFQSLHKLSNQDACLQLLHHIHQNTFIYNFNLWEETTC